MAKIRPATPKCYTSSQQTHLPEPPPTNSQETTDSIAIEGFQPALPSFETSFLGGGGWKLIDAIERLIAHQGRAAGG
ncbi:hypothetical protein N7447_002236 [Penicillium robsamsonii]|uniref:uncharacterized protein n=1 Tax=Penicillium robsamsonii TaxID=1792511 RepID=UPI002547C0F5|nr:uncharacterized protein N7447_002236 [Penicillium robsamsonii]KAJ5836210.1 hypothetical protein N7447_002236 [Penicillium robsamsonii]